MILRMEATRTKQLTVDEDIHAWLKTEAKRRGMTLQAFARDVLRGALRLRGYGGGR